MKFKYPPILLFFILAAGSIQAQPGDKQIDRINKFNLLFGDYFYVNDHMEILALNETKHDFSTFYSVVREKNWSPAFENNLDDDSILKQTHKNVITMNLKFKEEGILFRENVDLSIEKQKGIEQQLYLTAEMQKLKSSYYQDSTKKYKNSDSIDAVVNKIIKTQLADFKNDPNGYELNLFANRIAALVKKHNIKHVFFFVHGYNVTHSLAQMQGNRLLDQVAPFYKENILFVRVFWVGGQSKELEVDTQRVGSKLLLKNFVYKDETSIKNARGFRLKKKEAITCGYSFRRLLTMLEKTEAKDCKIHLVSHSLGAVLVSTALVNDVSPICYKHNTVLRLVRDMDNKLDACCLKRMDSVVNSKDFLTRLNLGRLVSKQKKHSCDYVSMMRQYNPPDMKVDVLMNAPAVPGINLFRFADMSRDYNFIIGHNLFDPTLAKRFVYKKTMLSGKLSFISGDTRLGLNYNNEVGQTEFLISKRAKETPGSRLTLKGYRSSNFFEHDIFFYMKHPLFSNILETYLRLQ